MLILTKNNKNIEGVCIFESTYLHTTYADDSIFFLKKLTSIKKLLDTFTYFHDLLV